MIAYCHSVELEAYANRLPSNIGRSRLVHSLFKAHGLLEHEQIVVVKPVPATYDALVKYHTPAYAGLVLDPATLEDTEQHEEFGLDYDCPVFVGLAGYISLVAGASITAADALIKDDTFKIAINWDGGRHHAKKGSASGFCYVADAVLAIQQLRQKFDGVVYIDLDLHHGDGVESAFLYSDKVLTISLHRYDAGFFPNTGSSAEHGKGKGKGFALNLPLRPGLSDASLLTLVRDVVNRAIVSYAGSRKSIGIVIQCGVDGLAQDPLRQWNLSIDGFAEAVCSIQRQADELGCKVLYLGGGGYNSPLASRCYATLTARLLGTQLPDEIPEHELWDEYADTVHEMATSVVVLGAQDGNTGILPDLIRVACDQIARYIHK